MSKIASGYLARTEHDRYSHVARHSRLAEAELERRKHTQNIGCQPERGLPFLPAPLPWQASKVIFTFIEVGDGGGCVLEGDPERKSWLLTHSVWKQKGGIKKKIGGKKKKKTHTRT